MYQVAGGDGVESELVMRTGLSCDQKNVDPDCGEE